MCDGPNSETTIVSGMDGGCVRIDGPWAVFMRSVSPADGIRDLVAVRQASGPTLSDGKTGASPSNLRRLRLIKPKFIVCVEGRDGCQVEQTFEEAAARLLRPL